MPAHRHIEIEHAVPELEPGIRFRKWVSLLVGLAVATAGVLAFAEADSNREKEHGFVDAARYAEQIFVELGASAQVSQFEGNAARSAIAVAQQGAARVIGSKGGPPFAFALSVSHAAERSSKRLLQAVQQMGTVPPHTPGLDRRTAEAVRATPASAVELLGKQRKAVDDADRWATRQEHTIFALGLTAIAAALGGLAGLMGLGRPGRLSAATGSVALLVAVVWSGVTFLS
jgi:hypothetical protein